MQRIQSFSTKMPPVQGILVGVTDGAARTADYISLKNCPNGVAIICSILQGNAATVTLSLHQATDVSATSEKVFANTVPIYSNLDVAASDTLVRRTDAINYTTDAGVKSKIVIFEVLPEHLDVSNGFDCITVKSGLSHADNLFSLIYVPLGRRYEGVSMITD